MARPIESALADMLDAIEDVEALIKGVTLAAYNRDFKTRLAVERCIEIISEAARAIPAVYTKSHPDIPWKEIRGVGNVLRHEYHNIANQIMWTTATQDIAPLKAALLEIKKSIKKPPAKKAITRRVHPKKSR